MAPAEPEESEPPEAVAPEAPKLDVLDGTGVSEEPPFRMDRAKIQRMFQIMDAGDSGALDHDAIARHAFPSSQMQRKKLRHVYAKQLIEVADTSADGRVDYDEFERFVRHKEVELWILFSQLDRHGDGELDLEDLTHALKLAGIKVKRRELHAFMSHVDVDNDGVITYEDWLNFLLFHPQKTTLQNVYSYYLNLVHQTDSGDPILLPESQKSSILTFKYMLAGGFAGAVSRTCTAPLDRLKILLQVNSSQSSMSRWQESIQLCRRILNEGGITAFWRGNGVNIIKIIPESAIRFYVFEWCKRLLQQNRAQQYHRRRSNDPSVKVHNLEITWQDRLIAGGVAGFASQLTIYPLETVKTRMMAELKHTQVGSNRIRAIDVARQMWRTDGYRAFFRGLGPSLFGIVPYASIDLTTYETLKCRYLSMTGERQASPAIHLACGAVSGAVSASIVYPLGLIRTRLQAQGTSTHTQRYPRGAIDVIQRTWEAESFKGFYRGLVPNLVKVVPAVSLSYICYEAAKKQLHLI